MLALIFFVIAAAAQGLVPGTFVGSHEDATIDLESSVQAVAWIS